MKGVYIPHCPTNGIMLGYKQDLFLLNPSFSDHLRHISRIGDMFIPYLDALKYQIINNMIHIFHQYSPLWQCCFGYVYISDRRWHIISIYISYIYIQIIHIIQMMYNLSIYFIYLLTTPTTTCSTRWFCRSLRQVDPFTASEALLTRAGRVRRDRSGFWIDDFFADLN